MFNETLERSFFFYVFKFMFDEAQNKRVSIPILSHSATRIRYKNAANFQVKYNNSFWDMSRGEKECYNFVLNYSLLYNFSALKHSDTKDKIKLVTLPNFFHAFPCLPRQQLFRQRLLCRQNQKKKKKVF